MSRLFALIALAWFGACAGRPDAASPAPFPHLAYAAVELVTSSGSHRFHVWVANDEASRQQGLMHVRRLPPDHGMLFLFERIQYASFWMKDTYIALDLVFIARDGSVVNVARNARPLSVDPIVSKAPVKAVLELVAGTATRIGLAAGDRIVHPAFVIPAGESES